MYCNSMSCSMEETPSAQKMNSNMSLLELLASIFALLLGLLILEAVRFCHLVKEYRGLQLEQRRTGHKNHSSCRSEWHTLRRYGMKACLNQHGGISPPGMAYQKRWQTMERDMSCPHNPWSSPSRMIILLSTNDTHLHRFHTLYQSLSGLGLVSPLDTFVCKHALENDWATQPTWQIRCTPTLGTKGWCS